ncbi:MAG: tetratricopeptide repeat protein [Dehalococcoidia bacterium]
MVPNPSSKEPIDSVRLGEVLKEAFRLGEVNDISARKKAIAMYQDVLSDCPEYYDAWFNLGVIQVRNGQWQDAIKPFSQAEQSPELKVVAAFARLKLLVDQGRQVEDADFPAEFRGDNRGALGVQGPCHNAANDLRNRGHPCTVEDKGESCSIVSIVGAAKYTIAVNDLMGVLMKNVFREEHGKSVSLGDVQNLSETDLIFGRLDVGRLPLVQAPILGALDGVTYGKLRSAAQRKTGPHGWTREGRSFEEVAAQNRADAMPHGVTMTQILNIEDIVRHNCRPGTSFACVLDDEPHTIVVLHEVMSEHIPTIKGAVDKGACVLRGEFFSIPEYPLVHMGLGIPVEFLDNNRVSFQIVDDVVNFVEANFQDWVAVIEAREYTMIHVYGPDYSHIASGRIKLETQVITGIVDAVNQANSAFKSIPLTVLDFQKATATFYEQHPHPFIWSSK